MFGHRAACSQVSAVLFYARTAEVRAGTNLCRRYACFSTTSEGSATSSQSKIILLMFTHNIIAFLWLLFYNFVMFLFTVQFLPLPSPSFILGYLEFWGSSSVCTCIYFTGNEVSFSPLGLAIAGSAGPVPPPLTRRSTNAVHSSFYGQRWQRS